MRIEYKGKKWEKEIKEYQTFFKQINYQFNRGENYLIQEFENNNKRNPYRLFACLEGEYEAMARYYYMYNNHSDEVVKYTYLSGRAGLIVKRLWGKGFREAYISDSKATDVDYSLFSLIACNETLDELVNVEAENLIMLMYNQNYELANQVLNSIEVNEKGNGCEWYYYDASYLKPIYMAIINHDEKAFNEGVEKRIKKYRSSMVGYSVIVDVVSVALIKIAKKAGIDCTVDVIEIPKQFLSEERLINPEECKLPYYDELVEKGLIP